MMLEHNNKKQKKAYESEMILQKQVWSAQDKIAENKKYY